MARRRPTRRVTLAEKAAAWIVAFAVFVCAMFVVVLVILSNSESAKRGRLEDARREREAIQQADRETDQYLREVREKNEQSRQGFR